MADPTPSLADKMAALSNRFEAKIDERTEEIEAACNRFLNDGEDDATVQEGAITLAHRLAGSSGTMGFAELGKTAAALERALKSKNRTDIEAALQTLKEAAERKKRGQADCGEKSIVDGVETQAQPKGNASIHLLEENHELAEDISLQLGHFGYKGRVHSGGDGGDGEEDGKMIVHIHMPTDANGGMTTVTTVRRDHGNTAPLMVVSERDDLQTRLLAVRAGADAFFPKPLNIGRLVETLDELTADQIPDPYRVLVVDDDSEQAQAYSLILNGAGIKTEIITEPLKVMELLSDFQPDLLLLDINMPSCSGLELATVIRQQEAFVQMPIVFLTADGSQTGRLSAMRTGADEFLTKPPQADLLLTSVLARAERSRALGSMISCDSMTRLPNHTKIKEHLETELERAKRQNQSVAFAMIDIDLFKKVNDTHGHLVGDHVIQALAQVLRQRLRKTDIVGRYGGEEFAAILPDTDGETARKVLDDIRDGFGRIRHLGGGGEFFSTFSCGIATYPPTAEPVEITKNADDALYQAKDGGRNKVVLSL